MDKLKKNTKLWSKAIKIIPGGNGLLSKRPERFLPDYWPTYYSKCKGIEVVDLNGNKFLDFSNMAVGSNILGYANEKVNKYVKRNIDSGNNCTLNSPLEVELTCLILKFIQSFMV